MYTIWTDELDLKLKDVYENGTISDILKIMEGIPWKAVCRKALRLGLHRSREIAGYSRAATRGSRKDSCSEAEATLLKKIFENNSKKFIIEEFKKAGFDRSTRSIFRFAQQLGLKRNPELIKQDMVEGGKKAPCPSNKIPWTNEENLLLKNFYATSLQNEIENKLPGRTFKAIRERVTRLGLFRDKKYIDIDRAFHLKKNLGIESTWQLEKVKKASKETNLAKRGVEYPMQSPEVQEANKRTVQKHYGVDNVFQAKEIKEKSKKTNLNNLGVENPQQSPIKREQTRQTNQKKYGVDNTFQLVDRVQAGMKRNHGVKHPLQSPKIKARQQQTNIEKYGFKTPSENPAIKEKLSKTLNTDIVKKKKFNTSKEKNNFGKSSEEDVFLIHLKKFDETIKRHQLHPVTLNVIDYYSPKFNLWIQYDSIYWHGKNGIIRGEGPQSKRIRKTIEEDKFQNENIPNLIRFWSDEVTCALKDNSISNLIKNKIEEKQKYLINNPIPSEIIQPIPNRGKTVDRKTPDKIQFLIDNYGKMTKVDLAKNINETKRWVKRQLKKLFKEGKLRPYPYTTGLNHVPT